LLRATIDRSGRRRKEELDVSAVGRNEPCPCRSGRKAKRCCGVRTGPSEAELAKSFLAIEARHAAPVMIALDEDELRDLWDDVFDLPGLDLSLVVPLPELLTPEIERLCAAVSDDDPDEAEAALPPVLAPYDTPVVRAELARNVIALRERGVIPPKLAAIALLDLALDSTAFLRASVIKSVAVMTGVIRTPGGLILATG
jgi:hypothetical protein